jgi:hypothetical protein
MKKHFTDEDCLDFVQRLLQQAQSDLIQQHLDDGCERCNKLHSIWSPVAEVTCRKFHDEPSEPAVRIAKALYANSRWNYLVRPLAKMIPPVFDSFLNNSATAVRSHQIHASERRLLYRTRSWAVDVRLESEEGRRMSVVGQVLRSSQKPVAPVIADVILMQGETLLAQTSTNQFGEFQLQSQHEKNVKIYLHICGRRPLGIALPDPHT